MIIEELNNINVNESENALLQNVSQMNSWDTHEGFTFVELFAGIGGISFGLESVGGKGLMAAEFDPFSKKTQYAQEAYKLLHPYTNVVGDVTKLDAKDVPDCDVLSFTPPCQSFSISGKRLGFEDTRGTLVFEALRIAKEKKPKFLFMENVKGLLSHDDGQTFEVIVHAMNEIGYTVDFNVMNSKFFHVPQNRERIFIIAIRDDLVTPEKWIIKSTTTTVGNIKKRLLEQNARTYNFDWPEQTYISKRINDILEEKVDEKYYYDNSKIETILNAIKENGELPIPPYEESNKMISAGLADLNTLKQVRQVYYPFGIAPTLDTMQGGYREPKILEKQSDNTYKMRKLTPLECLRLQGFSDQTYSTLVNNKFSNSRIYKFSGNAVTVSVIHALGEKIVEKLNAISIREHTYLN